MDVPCSPAERELIASPLCPSGRTPSAQRHGRTVLVIGGASGIGRATVARLLRGGECVIVADRDRDGLDALRAERAAEEARLATLELELTQRRSVTEGLRWIREEFGALDGVVVSAGVHSTCPVEHVSDAAIESVLDVNLMAHIKLVRDLLPLLKVGGRLIGLSSIAGGLGIPMSSLYSASKAGLEAFYESLAVEVSDRQVHIVLIQPGNVNTGFNETGNVYQPTGSRFLDDGYRRVVSAIDSRRGMDPADVAAVIVSALRARKPRFCYVVGPNARKAYWAKRLLGREMALRLMARHFGFR